MNLSIKALLFGAAAILSSGVMAAPSFKIYEVAVPLSKQAAVLEATDTFMQSKKGKSYKGGLHVNTILANGISPATHSFVLLMDSMAAIEEWETGLVGDPDIAKFWAALDANSTPVSQYMGSLIKTWGDISNNDRVWMITRFRTTDPMAVVRAQDKLSAATRDDFPGQVVLHSIPVGSRGGANNDYSTHMLVAGYESVAEMEAWSNNMNAQPAWAEYLGSLRSTVTWQGTDLIQNTVIYDDGMDVKSFHGE
jgi:hypothetical protein